MRGRLLLWGWILTVVLCSVGNWGCSKEPERGGGIEIPSGPRDDRDDDDDEGDDNGDNEDDAGGNWDSGGWEGYDPDDSTGGNDDSNNDSNVIENDEEIVGVWRQNGGSARIDFDAEQNFVCTDGKRLGFKEKEQKEARGNYTYSQFKQHLWLYVQGEGITGPIMYPLEFKCVLAEDKMTLTSFDNKETELIRVK